MSCIPFKQKRHNSFKKNYAAFVFIAISCNIQDMLHSWIAASHLSTEPLLYLNCGSSVVNNLVPVTLGNIVEGAIFQLDVIGLFI